MSNNYYVGVERGSDFRRSLLLTSKNVLQVLKGSATLSNLRKEKQFLQQKLRQEVQEIMLLMEKLDEAMPEDVLKNAPVKPKIEKHETKKPVIEKVTEENVLSAPSRPLFELDKLERALNEVEQKLKYLG